MINDINDTPLEELFRRTLELNKKYLNQSVKVLRQMSSSDARKDMLKVDANIYKLALRSFTKLNLEYYNKMLEVGLSIADEFLGGDQDTGNVAEPSFVLKGSGKPGDVVTLQFVLENTKSETVQCELMNSPFVEESNSNVVAKIASSFEPQAFSQKPGESQPILINLQINEGTQPGTYVSDVKVVGFDTSYFSLVLTVEQSLRKTRHAESKNRPTKKS